MAPRSDNPAAPSSHLLPRGSLLAGPFLFPLGTRRRSSAIAGSLRVPWWTSAPPRIPSRPRRRAPFFATRRLRSRFSTQSPTLRQYSLPRASACPSGPHQSKSGTGPSRRAEREGEEGPCSYGAAVGRTARHDQCSLGLPWGVHARGGGRNCA
jgi:hypothetical protein